MSSFYLITAAVAGLLLSLLFAVAWVKSVLRHLSVSRELEEVYGLLENAEFAISYEIGDEWNGVEEAIRLIRLDQTKRIATRLGVSGHMSTSLRNILADEYRLARGDVPQSNDEPPPKEVHDA